MNEQLEKPKCLNVQWEGHADCEHCSIRKNDIFSSLDVVRYAEILKPITQYYYAPKSILYVQGDAAENVFVIRNGIVKLEEAVDDGSVRIVRLLQSSDAVGIETLLDEHQVYDQSAVVLRGAHICKIPYSVFETLQIESSHYANIVMQEWHRQLEAADRVITEFSTGSVNDRVARVLIAQAESSIKRGSAEIEMLSVEDLSALTSVARESISRVMAGFKREGLLEKSGPNRMRYDWDGLNAQVGENGKS